MMRCTSGVAGGAELAALACGRRGRRQLSGSHGLVANFASCPTSSRMVPCCHVQPFLVGLPRPSSPTKPLLSAQLSPSSPQPSPILVPLSLPTSHPILFITTTLSTPISFFLPPSLPPSSPPPAPLSLPQFRIPSRSVPLLCPQRQHAPSSRRLSLICLCLNRRPLHPLTTLHPPAPMSQPFNTRLCRLHAVHMSPTILPTALPRHTPYTALRCCWGRGVRRAAAGEPDGRGAAGAGHRGALGHGAARLRQARQPLPPRRLPPPRAQEAAARAGALHPRCSGSPPRGGGASGVCAHGGDGVFNEVVWDVAVDPRLQGSGLGRALMERVVGALLRLGVCNVGLFAEQRVVTFYRPLGLPWTPMASAAWRTGHMRKRAR
ncbi:unnamed protein product [Closterium sp. NIES-64]|nr:unnamed protein product [Closterium sp. NIES-64]